jgi:hypothetical protein
VQCLQFTKTTCTPEVIVPTAAVFYESKRAIR